MMPVHLSKLDPSISWLNLLCNLELRWKPIIYAYYICDLLSKNQPWALKSKTELLLYIGLLPSPPITCRIGAICNSGFGIAGNTLKKAGNKTIQVLVDL